MTKTLIKFSNGTNKRKTKNIPNNFANLCELKIKLWGKSVANREICYYDSDNEIIQILNDEDWQICQEEFAQQQSNGTIIIKLSLWDEESIFLDSFDASIIQNQEETSFFKLGDNIEKSFDQKMQEEKKIENESEKEKKSKQESDLESKQKSQDLEDKNEIIDNEEIKQSLPTNSSNIFTNAKNSQFVKKNESENISSINENDKKLENINNTSNDPNQELNLEENGPNQESNLEEDSVNEESNLEHKKESIKTSSMNNQELLNINISSNDSNPTDETNEKDTKSFEIENMNEKKEPVSSNIKNSKNENDANTLKDIIHKNICCRRCKMSPLVGIRYKCSICHDFDLCQKCELNIEHSHPMMRFRQPAPLNKAHLNSAFLDFKSKYFTKQQPGPCFQNIKDSTSKFKYDSLDEIENEKINQKICSNQCVKTQSFNSSSQVYLPSQNPPNIRMPHPCFSSNLYDPQKEKIISKLIKDFPAIGYRRISKFLDENLFLYSLDINEIYCYFLDNFKL